ncbi:MAG TPA: glycoside hydrolase family 32 protein [Fimbriimonas sp.]|nr:glycoside hydrolase family 32 protein [Fimbriimonas sp.]
MLTGLLFAAFAWRHPLTMKEDPEIQKAMDAAISAIPAAESDPERPAYHFHAPANWMNDPNGPIYYQGWYHLFYQFNPFGDQWGHMHWGHARSRDLVHWQHLPIAVGPTHDREDHIFSGSSFLSDTGVPTIIYTSISNKREPEQWAALPSDDDLLTWHKSPGDPVISQANHGATPIAEWRDPFMFKLEGKTHLITGGGLKGRGIVAIYEAENAELTKWRYEGVLFEHPDADVPNIECPNIGRFGGKWVLLVSVHGRVESFVGTLDPKTLKFETERRGVLNDGSYASQLALDVKGRYVHYAWVNTNNHKGWNGWMTLPSVLALTKDGQIVRQPVSDFAKLRKTHHTMKNAGLQAGLDLTDKTEGDLWELIADIDPGSSTRISIKIGASEISYDPSTRTLQAPGRPPLHLPGTGNLKLHVFLDRVSLDLYAADGLLTTSSQIDPDNKGLEISSSGAATAKSIDLYTIGPLNFDKTMFR